jgi:hypothetical protein
MEEVWQAACLILAVPEWDVAYKHATKRLETTTVRLCISLLNHQLHGSEYENALVSFFAVWAIDTEKLGFKEPERCTPDYSAFIKMAQMLVIYQAMEDVKHERADYLSTSMEQMRLKFMTFDGRTPMGWMHGLKAYGLKLAQTKTADGNIVWSDDLKMVLWKEFSCSMSNFRGFVKTMVGQAKSRLEKLFLLKPGESFSNIVPAPRLFAIKDNPSESKAGWSFLLDQRNNHLFDGSTWLVDRILGNEELMVRFFQNSDEGTWKPKAIDEYLSNLQSFLETLWVLVHVTSGQPARATELIQSRYCNTLQGEHRNVFVENGLVCFVSTYHKSYNMQGNVKLIHRFVPKEVSELIVLYLWLILPFRQFIEIQRTKTTKVDSSHALIWKASPTAAIRLRRKWDTARVSGILEQETTEKLKSRLKIGGYRHVAIAISRKHIKGYKFSSPVIEDDEAWDKQAAHEVSTAGCIYARELREAPGVIESYRERFRRISQEWHLFLGFETWLTNKKRPCPFTESDDEMEMSE